MEPWGIQTTESLAIDGIYFQTVEYQPGHWSERHAHETAFLDLMLSGAQNGEWNAVDVRRGPGTSALMPPNAIHRTDSVQPTRTFQVILTPRWSGFWEEGRRLAGPCSHHEAGPVAWGMTRMWAEFRRRDDLSKLVLESRLHTFLDGLQKERDEGEAAAPWLRKAEEFVRSFAKEGFAVSDLAAEVNVAPAHLMRSYRRRFGVTVGEDARRHRVAHACRLLASAEMTLGEVAVETGFADQSHLNRVLKVHTGLTPLEYRLMSDRPRQRSPL